MRIQVLCGIALMAALGIAATFFPRPAPALAERTLRVGIYDFKPLVYENEQGKAAGIYVDLLNAISRKEEWTPAYRFGKWPQCLTWLEQGRIDLLTGILRSEERGEKFAFSDESVLSTWGQLYAAPGVEIETFRDLEGKSIAVVEKGYFYPKLKQYLDEFDVNARFVEVETYSRVFRLAASGEVDACSAERVTGLLAEKRLDIRKTPLIYNHKDFLFAAAKGKEGILREIDRHLRQFKQGENSFHDKVLHNHLLGEKGGNPVPQWLLWALVLAGGLLVVTFALVLYIRRLLHARTVQLRQSEQKYRRFFQNMRDAILLADTDRRIIDCNPAFESLFGYSLQEIQGKKTSHVYENESEFRELGRALQEHYADSSFLMTVHYKKKSGEVFSGETGAFYLRDGNGEVAGFIGVIRDVTNRKRAEEALRKREEHLQAILQAAPDPLVVYDSVGHPQYINPAFTRVFGWTFQELQGQRIPFVPQDQRETTMAKIREIYRTGVPVTFDTTRWTKDQRLLNIRVSAAIIQSSLQEHYGLVVILTDITERKQLEQRLTELSLYDSLTGLYNRTFFQEEMKRLEDGRSFPMGIIVCDINGLKLINDTLGHDKGDELLRAAADILRQCFRSSDILARIGGDEFTVLLPDSGEEIVQACCRRIRGKVARFNQQSSGFGLSVAMGYAVDQAPPADLEGLFKRADDAMYKEKLQQSHSSRNETVQALIKTLEERDHITEGHAGRLNEYAQELGRLAGLSEDRLQDLQLLARFHDLGKVGIPDFILFKPGPLTDEEFQEMKRHCEIGHRIALSLTDLAPIADFILKHHEHWDGGGYPLGLSGEDIPLECRILAIVDAHDTMIQERPYKGPMSHEEALAELKRCAGTQFDPRLTEMFLSIGQQSPKQ